MAWIVKLHISMEVAMEYIKSFLLKDGPKKKHLNVLIVFRQRKTMPVDVKTRGLVYLQ